MNEKLTCDDFNRLWHYWSETDCCGECHRQAAEHGDSELFEVELIDGRKATVCCALKSELETRKELKSE